MTSRMRPVHQVAEELAGALEMAEATKAVPRDDPLVAHMLESNDEEVKRLEAELAEATASDLEISISGRPVQEHKITSSYLARLLTDTQSVYRSAVEAVAPSTDSSPHASSLLVEATAPGSFKVLFRTSAEPLSLLESPRSEAALALIFDLINGDEASRRSWSAHADEKTLRAVIRFAATLASSGGTTQLRWTRPSDASEAFAALSAAAARSMAADLAGPPGTELINVTGHLSRAQDDPPGIKVTAANGEVIAGEVRDDDLLTLVQALIFTEVEAIFSALMTTSPTTGAPSTRYELLDLRPASADDESG